MRNLKSILPMLAFVLAIGMSFAFTSATEEDAYFTAYVNESGTWTEVDVNCPEGTNDCTVQFVDENGNPLSDILDVYPIPSFVDENGDTVESLKSVRLDPELIVIQE